MTERKNCLRCKDNGRNPPNETTKLIEGIPICSQCLIQDASKNRGIAINYSFLKASNAAEAEAPLYVSDKPPRKKK